MRWLPASAATTILGLSAALALLAPSAAPAAPGAKGTLVMISSDPIGHPGFASVSLIDVAGGSSRVVLHGKDDICCSIAWSPDGRWIALAKLDGLVLLAGNGSHARVVPSSAPGRRIRAPHGRSRGLRTRARWRSTRGTGIGS
jgi:hypothetical protein